MLLKDAISEAEELRNKFHKNSPKWHTVQDTITKIIRAESKEYPGRVCIFDVQDILSDCKKKLRRL